MNASTNIREQLSQRTATLSNRSRSWRQTI